PNVSGTRFSWPSWDRRAASRGTRRSGGGTKERERSEPLLMFSAQRSLLKNQGCANARLIRRLAALAFFSTTPLASFLGSLSPPIPGGDVRWPTHLPEDYPDRLLAGWHTIH